MKKFFKFIFFGIVGFIGLIIAAGILITVMGGDSPEVADTSTEDVAAADTAESTESEADTTEENTESAEAEQTIGIGETLTLDDMEFTVNEWYQADSVGDDIIGSTANDTYLILDVTVKNNKNEAVMMMDDFFPIKSGEATYQPDLTASTYANQAISPDNMGFMMEEINPGSTRDALIVYDVSQDVVDATDKVLNVQTGMLGTKVGSINLQ